MSRRRLRPLRVLRALRLSRWPTVGSVVALALFFAGQLLGLPTLPLGMLLAVPLLIGTIGLGWHAGMAMLPVGLGLLLLGQGLRGEAGGWTLYATTLAVAVLSVATGHSLFTLWRRTEQRAHRSARRALLLSEATADLQGIEERGELFRTLPQLLGDILDFGHAEVFVPVDDGLELAAAYRWNIPAGFRVPLDSVTGRALSERRVQYVADTERLPHFLAAPNAPRTRSELALPLQVGERVAAVFNIEHPDVDGFSRRDRNTLQALARIGEAALARITDTEELQRRHDEQRQIAELTRRLTRAESAHQAAVWALEALRDALGLDTGMVLTLDRGRFRPLVVSGALPGPLTAALERGLDRHRGEVGRTWEGKRERFIEDYQRHPDADVEYRALGARGLLYAPILNPVGEALALVQLADFGTPHPFPEHERRLVRIVTDTLGVVFQREALHRQLAELLEVVRSLAQTDDPDQLYARAVEAAVRLIPGAESGSILVREGATFRFAAAEGFATDALRELPALSEEGQLIWYGGDREAFTAGRPRLLVGDGIAASSSASTEADGAELGEEARLHDLRANICVPITTNREVVGILNLDSLTAEDAFSARALELAHAFGQQIAVIIRRAHDLRALERAAVTDPLTGLGNREGFNRRLRSELARARRYHHPFHLLMIDLDRFKEINDTLGHQAGDRALVEVAQTMRAEMREGDTLFRWGGDEFALILPHIPIEAARRTAERYLATVGDLRIGHLPLSLSIGIASYPEDGEDSESLLRRADDLMYRQKGERGSEGSTFEGASEGVPS